MPLKNEAPHHSDVPPREPAPNPCQHFTASPTAPKRTCTAPNEMNTTLALIEVKRIMVALVAAATSGSTPISSISGPCQRWEAWVWCGVGRGRQAGQGGCTQGMGGWMSRDAPPGVHFRVHAGFRMSQNRGGSEGWPVTSGATWAAPSSSAARAHLDDTSSNPEDAGAEARRRADDWVEERGASVPFHVALKQVVPCRTLAGGLVQQVRPAGGGGGGQGRAPGLDWAGAGLSQDGVALPPRPSHSSRQEQEHAKMSNSASNSSLQRVQAAHLTASSAATVIGTMTVARTQ